MVLDSKYRNVPHSPAEEEYPQAVPVHGESGNENDRKGCGYCTFVRYNLSFEESRKGCLRAKPIHKAGSGSSFEEMYLRKVNDNRFLLIVDSAHVHIERPVKFCPCCGHRLNETQVQKE